MRQRGSRLIERYIVKAIVPYFALALLLLTMILYVQQSSRFAELLLLSYAPRSLVTDVAVSLLPSVLAFTLPMAMLAGTIIGFSRMRSDSELVAIRAAGVSSFSILWPPLLIGLGLSIVAFYINFEGAPAAALSLKRAGLEAALHKLDSPVEPRTFNTEIPGYVLYVGGGDNAQGKWERVFIYTQDRSGARLLITAASGRIDAAAEQSELVLTDAVRTTLPSDVSQPGGQIITERLTDLRIVLETGRKKLLASMQEKNSDPDEMRLFELVDYVRAHPPAEAREAATLLNRKLALTLAPFIFALLGGTLSLHLKRVGKGWGSLLSLVTLIAYYMLSLFGDAMSRKGTMAPIVGAWLATAVAACLSLILLVASRWTIPRFRQVAQTGEGLPEDALAPSFRSEPQQRLLGFPSILDRSLLRSLTLNFAFAYVALVAIFLIVTSFELLRFVVPGRAGMGLLARYLIFLVPFATVQLMPASLLIAVLLTYALVARRGEAIAWWASGQSVYRLIMPGVVFALVISLLAWTIQERIMPQANVEQDSLRARIRSGITKAASNGGQQWLASGALSPKLIYSYEYDEEQGSLKEPIVYEFDSGGIHLERIVSGGIGTWRGDALEIAGAWIVDLRGANVEKTKQDVARVEGPVTPEMFKRGLSKPAQLSSEKLSSYIAVVKPSGRNVTSLVIALQRKYAEPHAAWIMALFGIPLALSFGRRGAITALSAAIGISLAYWGAVGGFQLLGEYEVLSPTLAAWFPLLIFAMLGVYFLTRART